MRREINIRKIAIVLREIAILLCFSQHLFCSYVDYCELVFSLSCCRYSSKVLELQDIG